MAIGDHVGTVHFRNVSHPDTMNAQVNEETPASGTLPVSMATLDSLRAQWQGKPIGLVKD